MQDFPDKPLKEVPDSQELQYVVIKDSSIRLSDAAALSANFPPVFPNAIVDINDSARYWVTDGGATDNRGIISLLYVLKGVLESHISSASDTSKNLERPVRDLPDIYIIVADASAFSIDYQQDLGVGTKFGAPEKFASQLMTELVGDVIAHYDSLGGQIHFHYLPDASNFAHSWWIGNTLDDARYYLYACPF